MNWFKYTSPSGLSVTFGDTSPRYWDLEAGLLPNAVTPVTRQVPGQRGVVAVDVVSNPKTVTMTVEIAAVDNAAAWQERADLAAAFAVDGDEGFAVGELTVARDGQPVVTTPALPVETPELEWIPGGFRTLRGDVEFFSPSGVWFDATVRTHVFDATATAFELPADLPWDLTANAVTQTLTVPSTVRTPFNVRFHGLLDQPRLRNLDTGDVIVVTGSVPSGDYVDVDTDAKTVTLVDSGVSTNILDRWAWGSAKFWQLTAGVNNVQFESDAGGGYAVVTYRPVYSAI